MNWIDDLKFNEGGLISAVAQDYKTGLVLMQAYMNRESIKKTLETGKACYFSRSRNELWLKGETSGNVQWVKEILRDCDGDCLLLLVEQTGEGACHTGNKTCFYTPVHTWESRTVGARVLFDVYDTITDRRDRPVEGSYTNYLFEKGADKILKKIGEESAETIIATKNKNKEEIVCETADLIYHLSVNLSNEGLDWCDIFEELSKRRK